MLFLLFLCLCWFSSVYLLLSVYVYCLTLMRLPCPCFWINAFGHFSWLAFLLHHLLHCWDHRTSCRHPLSLPWAILEFTCVTLSILLFWPVICPYFTAILFQFDFSQYEGRRLSVVRNLSPASCLVWTPLGILQRYSLTIRFLSFYPISLF